MLAYALPTVGHVMPVSKIKTLDSITILQLQKWLLYYIHQRVLTLLGTLSSSCTKDKETERSLILAPWTTQVDNDLHCWYSNARVRSISMAKDCLPRPSKCISTVCHDCWNKYFTWTMLRLYLFVGYRVDWNSDQWLQNLTYWISGSPLSFPPGTFF